MASPNILYIDIETSPNVVYSWHVGNKVSLSPDNIIEERKIICVCFSWEGERDVYSLDWGTRKDDKQLLKKLTKVLSKADVVVAHNGDRYDVNFINGRLCYHELAPLPPTPTIDTLKKSRGAFFINSHRLDYLGRFFNEGKKQDTGGFSLWTDVCRGDIRALNKMIAYCKHDVRLLEKVYKRIRPYMKNTVHMGVLHGDVLNCKSCGSSKTKWDGNRVVTKIRYKCRKCNDCGHWWRTDIRSDSI